MTRLSWYHLPLLAGAGLLAFEPLRWLINTWIDPLYDSIGLWIACAVLALWIWSLATPRLEFDSRTARRAVLLLLATAIVRLVGQVLGINIVGALALVIDVYALALLSGVAGRSRALSPFWLAVLFAFSLPLERVVQRSSGYLLQQLSAAGTCEALGWIGADVSCQGVRIVWNGLDVLVDLPCSGAAGLTLLLTLFAFLATLYRPSLLAAGAGLLITLAAAFVANCVRIVLLAAGLVHADVLSIDVMAAPWHELIGLFALGLGALAVWLWSGRIRRPRLPAIGEVADGMPTTSLGPLSAAGFLIFAAIIVALPARPLDVARPIANLQLPPSIAGFGASPSALTPVEQEYFTRYGGAAARAEYGPFGLLVVSTSAPLRHLHAPDECLVGMGYEVRYLGARFGRIPSALYRAVDSEGRSWRVAVTYVSEHGEVATSVGEAVWRWLQRPGSTWTMIQRTGPSDMPISDLIAWDRAVALALDIPSSSRPQLLAQQEL